ncbi:Rab3 GTPase-activating protein catalytic subunit [Apophysomyces ossiformis]|uniref:Rab3 GTPase-activating protein catalytic subunit n=1 Tax=Apophysomyces ossiformis TaxID=679940 RepID=A0A8H7BJY2_9FUNG|nr:Rab3 GTPase-activating protein catalytic subunit [Apophysomyces ossiformis]
MDQFKRRQSSITSEEHYEFVDYTSVSDLERLVTAIEEALRSWGVINGSFGIFSDDQVNSATTAILNPSTTEFSRREQLVVGDEKYELTFYCHPATIHQRECGLPLALDDFFLFETDKFHPLHRWTGLGRFLILAPVSEALKGSSFLSSGRPVVDLHQAKSLISACAIAFQNTGCTVPAFVQMGLNRYGLYLGYMLCPAPNDPLNHIEFRFKTCITSVSPEYTDLSRLQDTFLKKLALFSEDRGSIFSTKNNADIWATAVFTYNLSTSVDRNWKILEEEHYKPAKDGKKKRRSSFSEDFEDWYAQPSSKISATQAHLPSLPFGPYNDPLRSFTLNAIFPIEPVRIYTESSAHLEMDAWTARIWKISRELAPPSDQRAFLSSTIDNAIKSWIKDPANHYYLAPYDKNNRIEDTITTGHDSGLVRNLLHAMSQNRANAVGSQVTITKLDQIERILDILFQATPENPHLNEMMQEDCIRCHIEPKNITLPTASALGMRLKHGTSVPCRSFLWQLLLLSLDVSPDAMISTYMGFFRTLWSEVVRKIRWYWENRIPVPNISTRLYSPVKVYDTSETVILEKDNANAIGVDLRFNILHQKLAMINCCIHRDLQRRKNENGRFPEDNSSRVMALSDSFADYSKQAESGMQTFKGKTDKQDSKLKKIVEEDDYVGVIEQVEESNLIITGKEEELDAGGENDTFFDSLEVVADIPRTLSDINLQDKDDMTSQSYSSSTKSSLSDHCDFMEQSIERSYFCLNNPDEIEIEDPYEYDGRSHQHEDLCLLRTGEPMWIPIIQDPGFVTEDMIDQQADVFESMGSSQHATLRRAELMSAQLKSDMKAFKAANPHAILEDFIRWYSPKDWIEDKDASSSMAGKLSTRMSGPDNLWQQLWRCTRRVPASRQKPLFDIVAEGEKALHYLETISAHEVLASLFPTLGILSYDTLLCHPVSKCSRFVALGLQHLSKELADFPWDGFRNGQYTIDYIISTIRQQELLMSTAISLLRKLPKQYHLVDRLLESQTTYVEEGEERAAISKMFDNNERTISEPFCREYVLYSDRSAYTSEGHKSPHRQYAMIKDNEIRIIDMSSTDALVSNSMWRREKHSLLDVRRGSIRKDKDDLGRTRSGLDKEASPIGPWDKLPLVPAGTNVNTLVLRDRPYSPFRGYYTANDLYPGDEFDIFSGAEAGNQPLTQVDPFSTAPIDGQERKPRLEDKEDRVIIQQRRVRKWDGRDVIANKRKRTIACSRKAIFLKSTAAIDTPANFFMPQQQQITTEECVHHAIYL